MRARGVAQAIAALSMAMLGITAFAAPPSAARQRKSDARAEKEAAASFDGLSEQLRDPEPAKRRSAVRGLVKLGRTEGWRCVFEALADSDSSVGDEAQLAITALLDAKLWKELTGRAGLEAKDELVALRVAEAIGLAQMRFDAEELARQLALRDRALGRTLIASVGRLAAAGRLEGNRRRLVAAVLQAERSNRDEGASCAALVTLAELGAEEALKAAIEALRDGAGERRTAALIALAQLKPPEAYGAAVKLAGDEDLHVRLQALDTLDALGSKAAMTALVARLGVEQRLRLRWRIVDLLQSASGLKHRLDPRPWKLWIEQLPPEGVVRRPGRRTPAPDEPGATRVGGFAGLQLLSDRVCFLFDFSGSMWTPLGDGRTPKDIVSEKLREALETLPPETEFNLIPFTNVPIPWAEHAQPATPKNVQRALEFFIACRERGRGNFYDAALLAASDPRVDTLCVLTDGVPTGGVHSDMDLITPLFVERTRFRRVVVDSILVDAPPGAARRWAELARLTGGRSIEVELEKELKPPK